ncbi:MAG TPA: hypothetical protein G4N95_07100 [Anaerolineae bacterium]|nr:hypothetical protein [Anaerolineae bacterium]
MFTWLENDASYPDIVIDTGAIISEVEANTSEIGLWAYNTLLLPGCTDEVNANYENGVFPEDIMTLISCKPLIALRPAAGEHLGNLLGEMIAEADVPASIDVGAELAANMDEESALTVKGQLNRVRSLTRILWIVPIFLLVIGLALLGRDRKMLLTWAGWPLFISGLIGIILASRLASPALILENTFMPPPASMPAPAAPIVMAILGYLLTTVGSTLQWQMGIIFAIGFVLLVYTYQEQLLNILSNIWEWLKLRFEVKRPESASGD